MRIHVVSEPALQRRIFELLGRWPRRLSLERLPVKHESIQWTPVPNHESLDDNELLEATGVLQHFPSGHLYAHTSQSASRGGCFQFAAAYLERFILEHRERYGEKFFCGDPLLVAEKEPLLWTLHHEGLTGLLRGPSAED